jgi:hypothetical protein
MPRAIRTLLVVLLLGVLLSVLLAWVPCITLRQPGAAAGAFARPRAPTRDLPVASWPYEPPAGLGAPAHFLRTESWRFTSDFGLWSEKPGAGRTGEGSEFAVDVISAGLPLRCFSCRYEGEWRGTTVVRNEFRGSLRLDTSFAAATLPYTPVWPGLIGNTVLCAGICWVAGWGPRAVRGWRRAKQNRCVGCGYSRSGLAKGTLCPECGNPAAGGGQREAL